MGGGLDGEVEARYEAPGRRPAPVTAAAIWVANVIVFGIVNWEVDGGGRFERALHDRTQRDFQFPQDDEPALGWRRAARLSSAVIAVVVLALIALASRSQEWQLVDLGWWVWLVLAIPGLLLCVDIWLGARGIAYSRPCLSSSSFS